MQKPYHIKVSLQEFYNLFYSNKWIIPDFSNKCPICKSSKCATFHGTYSRAVICPIHGFHVLDFPILRFKCNSKGDTKTCNHVTFSLLPIQLIPYRQLSLQFIVLAVWIKLTNDISYFKAMDLIEDMLIDLNDVADFLNISAQIAWLNIVSTALKLCLQSNIKIFNNSQYHEILNNLEDGLMLFLDIAINYEFIKNNHTIRGPCALALAFYQLSGGDDTLAPFLFGKASQHRV